MLQKMRDLKKSRRGFTLVEIIVVLVILAILAAFTIPAMLGYVQDAQAKADLAQARTVLIAAQATSSDLVSRNEAKVSDVQSALTTVADGKMPEYSGNTKISETFNKYIGDDIAGTGNNISAATVSADGKVTVLTFETSKTTQAYANGKWTSTKKTNK